MIRSNVQLTIEEIEILLDLLGPEQADESETVRHLRSRLKDTIYWLRKTSSPNLA